MSSPGRLSSGEPGRRNPSSQKGEDGLGNIPREAIRTGFLVPRLVPIANPAIDHDLYDFLSRIADAKAVSLYRSYSPIAPSSRRVFATSVSAVRITSFSRHWHAGAITELGLQFQRSIRSNHIALLYSCPIVTTPSQRSFVTAIEQAYSGRLRRFLASRLGGGKADLPDLIQEVYLRLLRIKDHDAIRNPQAYLFTIASHVLHQHRLQRLQRQEVMDPLQLVDVVGYPETDMAPDPADVLDIEERLEHLGRDLMQASPRAYAVLVMYRCEGMTLVEIGDRLGVSHVMVRKYLIRAIAFCDARLEERELGRS